MNAATPARTAPLAARVLALAALAPLAASTPLPASAAMASASTPALAPSPAAPPGIAHAPSPGAPPGTAHAPSPGAPPGTAHTSSPAAPPGAAHAPSPAASPGVAHASGPAALPSTANASSSAVPPGAVHPSSRVQASGPVAPPGAAKAPSRAAKPPGTAHASGPAAAAASGDRAHGSDAARMSIMVASRAAAVPGQEGQGQGPQCRGTIYLTFDTGSQSQAGLIAAVLKRQAVKATFFLANEKTVNGDYSLDPAWAGYWRDRVAEGHAFGSHTFDHTYYVRDAAQGKITVKPQFGPQAGKQQDWTPQQYCEELRRSDRRFKDLTGRQLDPFWRAPGGKTSPRTLAAGQACGYRHAAWATPAGFSGDELPVERASNAQLLKRALDGLRDGDIFMAHMGIWSRKDPWAPANLEPLIEGLKQKGYCFATLRDHPDYRP